MLRALFISLSESRSLRAIAERSVFGRRISTRFVAGTQLEDALLGQLADDGCLIAPVGPAGRQTLLRIRGTAEGWLRESLGAVSFVPLLGGVE